MTSRIAFTNEELDLIDSALQAIRKDQPSDAPASLLAEVARRGRLAESIREAIKTQRR